MTQERILGDISLSGKELNKVTRITSYLNEFYDIRVNEFDLDKSEILDKKTKQPVSLNRISIDMDAEGIPYSVDRLKRMFRCPEYIPHYNPITDYFNSLKGKYKGVSYIDMLGKFIIARDFGDKKEPGYYQHRMLYIIRKWMVATVSSQLNCTFNDVALGFIHATEGIGKTRFFDSIISPPELEEDFFYNIKDSDKPEDFPMIFSRYLIINFDELRGISARNPEVFKNLLSLKKIEVKEQGDIFRTWKRRIGNATWTSNKSREKGGFLTENMSMRRFGTIELESIDSSIFDNPELDRDQMWAEAVMLLEQSFNAAWDMDDYTALTNYNSRYIKETPEINLINSFYCLPKNGEGKWMLPTEIYHELLKNKKVRAEDKSKISAVKIGSALKHIGFEHKSKRRPGIHGLYMYHVAYI